MGTNLELLEDMVGRAARRLGELADDNRRLTSEARSLRERLAADEIASEAGGDWRLERADVLTGLRQALSVLREGG